MRSSTMGWRSLACAGMMTYFCGLRSELAQRRERAALFRHLHLDGGLAVAEPRRRAEITTVSNCSEYQKQARSILGFLAVGRLDARELAKPCVLAIVLLVLR